MKGGLWAMQHCSLTRVNAGVSSFLWLECGGWCWRTFWLQAWRMSLPFVLKTFRCVATVTKLFCRLHLARLISWISLESFIHWGCSPSTITAAEETSVLQTDRAGSGLSNGQQVLNSQPINTWLNLDLPQKPHPQAWWPFPLVNVIYLTILSFFYSEKKKLLE